MIRDLYERWQLNHLEPPLAAGELRAGESGVVGLDPSIIYGSEYLPSYRRDEVEIARIELDSTTSDVISLRARPMAARDRR
jgi:hypothetical protein